jgi:tRNA (uracil-5-)-methyltransferase
MDEAPQTGQTRPKPGSGSSSPIGKKPRLETPSEAIALDRIKDHLVSSTTPKKSAKKEARKAKKKGLHIPPEPYSTEDVLWRDVASILGQDVVDKAVEDGTEWESPFEFREEVDLTVHSISSNGTCFNLTIDDSSLRYAVEIHR